MITSAPARRQPETPPRREPRGVVERITFHNPGNGYTVARLAPERPDTDARAGQGADRLVTLVGTLPDLTPGEAIVASGWWENSARHGWQFKAVDFRTTLPATVQGMKKYLGSGLVKGVGPVMAGRIVDLFGVDTFDVVDLSPERLTEVAGIGPLRAQRITAAWAEQRAIREVMTALASSGVSTSLAARIYKKYGDGAVTIVTREPYRLAREVWGIGWKTADTIAQAVGIPADAPARLEAGALHALAAVSVHAATPDGRHLRPCPAGPVGADGRVAFHCPACGRSLPAGDLAHAAWPVRRGETRPVAVLARPYSPAWPSRWGRPTGASTTTRMVAPPRASRAGPVGADESAVPGSATTAVRGWGGAGRGSVWQRRNQAAATLTSARGRHVRRSAPPTLTVELAMAGRPGVPGDRADRADDSIATSC